MSIDWALSIDELRQKLRDTGGAYLQPLTSGSMRCVLYAPQGTDPQTPHSQDELYVITQGTGRIERGDEKAAFRPGDAFFVPAGLPHRFVDFSSDFECWAVFWGPKGGEG